MVAIAVSRARVEERARDLLLQFYRHLQQREGRAPESSQFFPVAVERIAEDILGWQVEIVTAELGTAFTHGGDIIGPRHGEADFKRKLITVTRRTGKEEEQRFSVAHEVGHVVLHSEESQDVLSRTRPLSSRRVTARSANSPVPLQQRLEREANVFAAALLMPEKALRSKFRQLFGAERLSADSDEALAITAARGRMSRRTLLETAEALARKTPKAGEPSLAESFGVSAQAMAIRLCELRLVQ